LQSQQAIGGRPTIKSRRIRWVGNVVQTLEGRRKLGRPKCRWEDNIKRILNAWDGRAWTGLSVCGYGMNVGLVNAVTSLLSSGRAGPVLIG
jgi:hypothetical protein